jgi:hypothetical protein
MKIFQSRLIPLSFTFLLLVTVLSSCFHGTSAPPSVSSQPVVMPPPPQWAPPYEYHERVRYYYLPDMECYYDVYTGQYVYSNGFEWIHSPYAPPAYSGYDMYSGYVVVLNYGVNDPWMNHATYMNSYPRGYYSQSNGASTNGNTNTGPRRGYNENDKSNLYPKGNSHSAPVPPANTPHVIKAVPAPVGTPVEGTKPPGPVKTTSPGMDGGSIPRPEPHKAPPVLKPILKEEPRPHPSPRQEPKAVKIGPAPEAPLKRSSPSPKPVRSQPPPQKQGMRQAPN